MANHSTPINKLFLESLICKQCENSVSDQVNSIVVISAIHGSTLSVLNYPYLLLNPYSLQPLPHGTVIFVCRMLSPFLQISNEALESLSIDSKIHNCLSKVINSGIYQLQCSTCLKKIKNKAKCFPCTQCKFLVHKKCANYSITNFKNLEDIQTWFCQSCRKDNFPYSNIDDFKFNSNKDQLSIYNADPSKIKSSFALNSLKTEMENCNIHCDYYDIESFQKLNQNQIANKKFSILHTNISSLKGNIENWN